MTTAWQRAPQVLQIIVLLWPASLLSAGLLYLLNGSLAGLAVVAMVAVVFGLFLVFDIKSAAQGMAQMLRPPHKNSKRDRAEQQTPPPDLSRVRAAGVGSIIAGTAASVLMASALW